MGYPTSLDNIPDVDPGDVITADIENSQTDAINAIESTLGTDPQGPYVTVADAIDSKLDESGGTMSGDIDMDGNTIANLAAPVDADDAISAATVQNSAVVYAADTGTTNTFAVALAPAATAYAAGMTVTFKALHANTGASTINVNSLGAKSLKKVNGSALESGDIQVGQVATVVYDGTNFQLVNTLPISPTYVGQTSITTLGTIATGTWQGTTVDVAHGGTGAVTSSGARTSLGAAASGSNSDITGLSALASDVSLNSHKLTNVTDPTSAQDAATKTYVDSLPNLPSAGQKSALAGSSGTPGSSNLYVTQQDRAVNASSLLFIDDFFGARDARWTFGGTGGTYTQNNEANGTGTMATGATNNNSGQLSFNGKNCFKASMSPRVKVRAKISTTTKIKFFAGLWVDSNNAIAFQYNVTTPAANFSCTCVSGGTASSVDSGVAADTNYHDFEFDTTSTSSVAFYIDGSLVATISTNIPTGVLEPIVLIQAKEAADKQLTIDLFHLDADRI